MTIRKEDSNALAVYVLFLLIVSGTPSVIVDYLLGIRLQEVFLLIFRRQQLFLAFSDSLNFG